MPRVSSTPKDVANSFLTKAIALKKLIADRNEDIELVKECADRPESRTYKTASRSIQMTSDLIESEINSLVNMHKKLVTENANLFEEFVVSVAKQYFVDAADAPNAISFAKNYGISLDD